MSTCPMRPPTKANSTNRRDWRYYGLAVGVLCILAVPAVAQSCMQSMSCMNPPFNLSAYYGGGNITINQCIDPNSPSCAWADAVMVPNMDDAANYFLACQPADNWKPPSRNCALLLFRSSGAPEHTPSCTLSQDGNAAQCNCYEINANTPGATGKYSYSYVELTSILNQDLYNNLHDCVVQRLAITNCLTFADILNHTMNPPQQSTTFMRCTHEPTQRNIPWCRSNLRLQ